ncbi:UDP-2,3-diacylglucosamine diphosphatase [Stenoxybacter acetivorans]|uniref:UDP-2,3-diacylglucosamine diphosphatase n=1 Tax=Stenoxybacter acetivorans TaxID=422441 RepID=UPI000B0FD05D|nr:UDP-2,3-diacylglucosamine diphosphatase [Stenoxybacter acetivorans]
MNKTLLIADLHLAENTPALNQLFSGSLKQWQGNIDALYILGDFFDVWVGDDDDSAFARGIKETLRTFTQHTPIYWAHGNRDFLVGSAFAAETGVKIITSPHKVTLYGKDYVLTHGDELCTDDLAYQQFRQQSRNPLWQMFVLSKPLEERRLLAGQIRQMSETRKSEDGKSEISDATENGIQNLMQTFADNDILPTLIHGHTHRPMVHQHRLGDKNFARYVIQDWENGCGGYLRIDEHGVSAHQLVL